MGLPLITLHELSEQAQILSGKSSGRYRTKKAKKKKKIINSLVQIHKQVI